VNQINALGIVLIRMHTGQDETIRRQLPDKLEKRYNWVLRETLRGTPGRLAVRPDHSRRGFSHWTVAAKGRVCFDVINWEDFHDRLT
jgi:hypothetical protein